MVKKNQSRALRRCSRGGDAMRGYPLFAALGPEGGVDEEFDQAAVCLIFDVTVDDVNECGDYCPRLSAAPAMRARGAATWDRIESGRARVCHPWYAELFGAGRCPGRDSRRRHRRRHG